MLKGLGVEVAIDPKPWEMTAPIRLDHDRVHTPCDHDAVERCWRVLIISATLFQRFSTNFCGKIRPAHFFWGSSDFAVTRFNGAKLRPGWGPIRFRRKLIRMK